MLRNGTMPAMPHPVPGRLSDRRSRRRSPRQKVAEPPPRSWPVLGIATRRALAAGGCARDRAILIAFLYGGLRIREILALRLDDLNVADEHIVVTGRGGIRQTWSAIHWS